MSKRAAQKAYSKAGIKPSDVQVVELHGKKRRIDSRTSENEYERVIMGGDR